jgi:hypothetical protein
MVRVSVMSVIISTLTLHSHTHSIHHVQAILHLAYTNTRYVKPHLDVHSLPCIFVISITLYKVSKSSK